MTTHPVSPDYAPFLDRCFLFDAVEDTYDITGISGQVPGWLRGSYWVNGPARFQRGGMRYKHWLDGDGMVYALHFQQDRIQFLNRFIQTSKLAAEESAGKALYRGFGTSFPADQLRRGLMLEPPVNVSVYPFAGFLLAFGEQTLPYELDPLSLDTRGEYDFNGRLTEVSPFAAHPKFEPSTNRLVNFGISFSASRPTINIYEFDPNGNQIRRRRHPLRYQHSNHDFGLTADYAVFFLSPLLMNFSKFWREGLSVMESLNWEPEKGSRIVVIPRESRTVKAFEVSAGCGKCLHFINCFESDRFLMVDVLEMETPVYPEYQVIPDLYSTVSRGCPVRYVVDLHSQEILERIALDYDLAPDFPSFDKRLTGHSYDDFWMLGISATGKPGRKFFDQLAHGSWSRGSVVDIFQSQPGSYLAGEPIFVSHPQDRRQAVIFVQHLDARNDCVEYLLFDAFQVAKGPIAALPLRHKIHPGFHASFSFQKDI